MYTHKGYYKPNVFLQHICYAPPSEKSGENIRLYSGEQQYYQIFFVNNGSLTVTCGETKKNISGGEVFVSCAGELCSTEFDSTAPFEMMYIYFHPSFLSAKQTDLLKVFPMQTNERHVYKNEKLFSELFNSLSACVYGEYGDVFIKPRIICLITEMNLMLDKENKTQPTVEDNKALKIIKYVDTNYNRAITLNSVSDLFFVSKTTINIIFEKYRKISMWQYVIMRRLTDAHELLKIGNASTKQVAEMCGFSTYSSFYRLYKKKYGVTPINDIKRKEEYWPLVNENPEQHENL